MKLKLVHEQRGQFGKLEDLLRNGIPRFVRRYPAVCLALIKYGMLTKLIDSIPDFHNQGALPDTFARRKAILDRALRWGTAPVFMVMGRDMFLDDNRADGWWGSYDPKKDSITLYKPLVEAWQKKPKDKVLYRAMVAVILHELVHYFNDQILPGSNVHSGPSHLRKDFHKEAFEKAPLNWPAAHHLVIKEVLRTKGVR